MPRQKNLRRRSTGECSVSGCGMFWRLTNGLCDKHYYRERKYGTPTELSHARKPFVGQDPVENFWSKAALTANPDKCWEWQRNLSKDGYGLSQLNSKPMRSHRIAWFLIHGELPQDGLLVLHSCDNRICVNPNHLRLGTAKDNAQDMVSRNRQRRGEQLFATKLNADKIREIKSLLADKISQRKIARSFGVSQHTINQISVNKTWTWVTAGA